MSYIYDGHLGSLFTVEEPLSFEEEYCEQCGDSDQLLGYAVDKKAAWKLLKPITNIRGSGGRDYGYVKDFIDTNFEK